MRQSLVTETLIRSHPQIFSGTAPTPSMEESLKKLTIEVRAMSTDDDDEWSGAETTSFFGVSLKEIYQKNGTLEGGLPIPVYFCLEALEQHIRTPGLFRTTGRLQEVAQLKRAFDLGKIPTFRLLDSVHSVANTLEAYFRELPGTARSRARARCLSLSLSLAVSYLTRTLPNRTDHYRHLVALLPWCRRAECHQG